MRSNKKLRQKGNTFFTALIFLFILAGTLRICCQKTLHESKLSSVFIQETQGYYLLENLMALARDYAYQINQNPMEPNIYLTVNAYKNKDKSRNASTYVIDFNGSLSKKQIVPDDFPLQIEDNSWKIQGGPIFWQDRKKDENDERYLSEVFMLGSFEVQSELIPNWTMRMAQLMEIERNPLCDFQLYSEGDTAVTGNITYKDETWCLNFTGPVQINAQARNPQFTGYHNTTIKFLDQLNIAGHYCKVRNIDKNLNCDYLALPTKTCVVDKTADYHNAVIKNPYTSGQYNIYYKTNAGEKQLSSFSNDYTDASWASYTAKIYAESEGKIQTQARVYRPSGFDPISDWGYWYTTDSNGYGTPLSADAAGATSANARNLEHNLGLHSLLNHILIDNWTYSLDALNAMRGLTSYQAVEKLRLTGMQRFYKHPGILTQCIQVDSSDIKNNFQDLIFTNSPYVTFSQSAFPAYKDNIYLNRYLAFHNAEKTIWKKNGYYRTKYNPTIYYAWNNSDSLTSQIDMSAIGGGCNRMSNNKLAINAVNHGSLSGPDFYKVSALDPDPTSAPYNTQKNTIPYAIKLNNDHWEIDNRLSSYLFLDTSTQRYKFIYDRNRAKWIQLFDIDISALCSDLDAGRISASDWAAWQHTINCNFYWQGDRGNGNPNYRVAADGGHDIRDNYVTDRKDNAAVVNVPVVDYGVRIVNAKNLPAGGLSIISPYPLYIQGDFNSDTKEPKAFIAADSITLLTDQWTDWRSSMDFGNSYLYQNKNWQYGLQRVDSNANDQQTIYAHIMTGRTHPHYWLTNETNIYPDLGIHDAFRTLEDHRTPIKLCGSLMLPYYSQWQWEPPINFCHYTRTPVSYAPANIYLDGTEWSKMRPTANMPFYHKINRGRKTQSIGESAYSVLNTIYSKDTTATSYTFDSYKNDLPNYLQ